MALAAAKRIVAKQGYGALSTRKVAADIGYAVGSLYLVFKNLDDLILHVNGSTLDDLHNALEATAVRCRDPETCLLALAREYIQFAFTNRALWSLVFEHPAPQRRPTWYQDKVARMFEMVEGRLRGIAPERAPKDLKLAAHALWSGVHGVSVLGLADDAVVLSWIAAAVVNETESFLAWERMQPGRTRTTGRPGAARQTVDGHVVR